MKSADPESGEQSEPLSNGCAAPAETEDCQPSLIWLIEDEELVGRLMRSALEGQGYEVRWFESGEAALEQLGEGRSADMLITDISLPGLSGIEVANRLSELWPGLPVLVTSGYLADVVSDGGVLPAQYEYLPKPFTPRGLIDRLSRMGHERTA